MSLSYDSRLLNSCQWVVFFSSLTHKLFKGIESNEDKEELEEEEEEEEEVGYTNEHEWRETKLNDI